MKSRGYYQMATSAMVILMAGGMAAMAGFPDIKLPKPPSLPKPELPKPPSLPKPELPKPPKIPNPIEEANRQTARINELRQQAERVLRDYKRMKEEAEKAQEKYEQMEKLSKSGNLDTSKEAYKALAAAGVLGTNRAEVMKGINGGFSVVIWGKEFDHFEEQKLAAALGASVASANPGPALVYIKQFALQTKAEVLKNLKAAPPRWNGK